MHKSEHKIKKIFLVFALIAVSSLLFIAASTLEARSEFLLDNIDNTNVSQFTVEDNFVLAQVSTYSFGDYSPEETSAIFNRDTPFTPSAPERKPLPPLGIDLGGFGNDTSTRDIDGPQEDPSYEYEGREFYPVEGLGGIGEIFGELGELGNMANKVFDAIGLGGLGNFGLGDILNTVNDVGGLFGGEGGLGLELGKRIARELGINLEGLMKAADETLSASIPSSPANSSPGGGGLFVPVKDFVQIALQTDLRTLQTDMRTIQSEQLGLLRQLVVKEYNLDPAAYKVSKETIRAILANVLNWINTGDDGNSFFLANYVEHFRNEGNKEIEKFLTEIHERDMDILIQRSIAQNVSASSQFARSIQPTISTAQRDAFLKDFNNGGWNMWLQMIQPQNNPLGQYALAENELIRRIQEAEVRETQEIAAGRGFKPGEVCLTKDTSGNCLYAETVTPGSTIVFQMNEIISSVIRQLEEDDELEEQTSRLLSSMIVQILGGRQTGLRGFSPSAVISPVANNTSVNRTKTGLQDTINTLLGTEVNYHIKKSASLIRMNEARISLGNLSLSATSTPNKQYATSTLATVVNPTMRGLALDIISATRLIEKIQVLLVELNSVNTSSGVVLVSDKYVDLATKTHSSAAVSEAQTEFDELDELVDEILQEIVARGGKIVPSTLITPPTTSPVTHVINMDMMMYEEEGGFSEPTIVIKKGDSITWKNMDSMAHTVTSNDGLFNSGNMNSGDMFTYTFNEVGNFPYNCTYHEMMGMIGNVVVQETTQPTTTITPPITPPLTPVTTPTTHVINMDMMMYEEEGGFSEPKIIIKKGDSITWKNMDSTAHTVTSESGAFNSGNMNSGDMVTYTFNDAGEFPYFCGYHKMMGMVGNVVVQ